MRASLVVFLGGGLRCLPAWCQYCLRPLARRCIPFYTLFENSSGSFLMGVVAGYFAFKGDASQQLRLFLTTGLLGGYTTFAAFSLDAALL
jgi:CrcB protein